MGKVKAETETKEVKQEEVKTEKKKSNKGLLVTLIVICSLLLAGLITCLVMLFVKPNFIFDLGKKTITITFDSDGGSKVEKMKFKEGTYVELPASTKEGYEFEGWYIVEINKNDEEYFKVGDQLSDYWTRILDDDITVKAKWIELKENETIMTINYDAKGGVISGNNSKTSQEVVKCVDNAYIMENMPTATKEGYRFMAWADKNGTPILDGASLICNETLDLYATYEKNEEKQKTAKCPTGYELSDNKCVTTGTVNEKCPSDTKVDGDLCIKTNDANAGQRQCKEYTVAIDGKGHTWTGKGDYYFYGNSYGKCAYYKWTAYTTKSACDAARDIYHSTVWVSELNGCYASTVMNNYETVCTGDYQFYSSSDLSSKFGINDNGKCLRKVAKEKFCDSGYTLTAGSCIKTVEPTYE
ncbi:MAG: InlB B-repeat-containing protein [Bacilli bacterium]|nr:InlB B-repeat-containing protein [Bacilli bacterium]